MGILNDLRFSCPDQVNWEYVQGWGLQIYSYGEVIFDGDGGMSMDGGYWSIIPSIGIGQEISWQMSGVLVEQ